jgi:CheY-like chemotaxis protein
MASILVVDDSFASRNATAALLRADGHRVTCADNAWRGLTILESMPIDLVVLDLVLPGLNGFGFLKDIQQNRRLHSLPVIVASALDVNPELWAQCQPQVKQWLLKGKYAGEELLDAVNSALPAMRRVTSAA